MSSPGKDFQQDFAASVHADDYFYRLKDCAGWREGGETRFTPSNDYDCFIYSAPNFWALELKSVKGSSLPFKGIRDNQIKGLLRAATKDGVTAGFVINYRSIPRTFFVPVSALVNELHKGDSKSLSIKRAEIIGTEIQAQMKITRYRYDVKKFLEDTGIFNMEEG